MSNFSVNAILRKLRPPYVLPARVAYPFSRVSPANLGLTFEVPVGAPMVAPGDGVVDMIAGLSAKWQGAGDAINSTAIRIDHGNGVKTIVHGLSTVTAGYGPIVRGQELGQSASTHVFFAVTKDGVLRDPTFVNSTFGIQDGFLNYGKSSYVRQAPDVISHVFSDIASFLATGIRYFFPAAQAQVLFNIDFSGANNKNGAAAIGAPGDVWHVVAAIDFEGTPVGYYGCYGATDFPAPQGFFLNDYRGYATKVYFERTLLTLASGTTAFFDPMLSTWVGGYTGITPLVNTFTIRNLPVGTYELYVYTNGGTTSDDTTVYCGINGNAPTSKVATPITGTAWVENRNYVRFTGLVLTGNGSITVSAAGYLAGLQLHRS